MTCDLRCLIFCQFIGNLKRKTVDEAEYVNYCLKVKNKNGTAVVVDRTHFKARTVSLALLTSSTSFLFWGK
jgi:hypothetical protein